MVYEPLEDSFLMQKWVAKFSPEKTVLDMGTGSGIQAITAFKSEAKKVLAVDIDVKALQEAKRNAVAKNANIEFRESNLFSAIRDNETFDLIVFNPPYLPYDENLVSDVDLSGGEVGNELTIHFLELAKKHLNENGFILIIVSSISDPFGTFAEAKSFGYDYQILEETGLNMETLYCVKLMPKNS